MFGKRLLLVVFIALPGTLFGNLTYEGSSTIGENILPRLTRAFEEVAGVRFSSISNQGSGKGVEAILQRKADIAGLSRPLSAKEKSENLYYQIIGFDAVAVYIHPSNPLTGLSRTQIRDIFTGRVRNWKEVGGANQPIRIYTEFLKGRRATIQEFQAMAMDGLPYGPAIEKDTQREILEAVSKDPAGITFASFSYRSQALKMLRYEGVEPTRSHVRSGIYRLSRPLILATREVPQGDVRRFIHFVLSDEGQKMVDQVFASVIDVSGR